MNKPHAAAYRKPSSPSAIQAALRHTNTIPTIVGSAHFPTIPRAALKWSSCLTSGPTLPPLGSNPRGTLYDPVTTLMGTYRPQLAPPPQNPMQREAGGIKRATSVRVEAPARALDDPTGENLRGTQRLACQTPQAQNPMQREDDQIKRATPVRVEAPARPHDDPTGVNARGTQRSACQTAQAQNPMQPDAPPAKPASTLRNGNPRGNPNAAPRCGAKTRAGCPCKSPAMKNGRCRMHGGASTGPSAEGRARIAAARTTHGGRTAAMRAFFRTIATIKRRATVIKAMAQAGMRVEDLAAPIRQCRTTPRSDPPKSRQASPVMRDRCFVLAELSAMDFTRLELRSLLLSLSAEPKQPPCSEAAQNPLHREEAPQPPRQPLTCQRPRHTLRCRRHDPANPFPTRTTPHATWNAAKAAPRLSPNGTAHCHPTRYPADRAAGHPRPKPRDAGEETPATTTA